MTMTELHSGNTDKFLVGDLVDSVDRLRYTYKTQEKAASRYSFYESARQLILIVCTVLATGTFVATLFALVGSEKLGSLFTGLLSTAAALAAFLGDVLDFSIKRQKHHEAGVNVRSLFVKSETLLSDYLAGAITAEETRRLRDEIQGLTDELLLEIPRTTRRDYKRADKALNTDERTSVEQEEAMRAFRPAE